MMEVDMSRVYVGVDGIVRVDHSADGADGYISDSEQLERRYLAAFERLTRLAIELKGERGQCTARSRAFLGSLAAKKDLAASAARERLNALDRLRLRH